MEGWENVAFDLGNERVNVFATLFQQIIMSQSDSSDSSDSSDFGSCNSDPGKTELEGGGVRYKLDVDHYTARFFQGLSGKQGAESALCNVTPDISTDGREVASVVVGNNNVEALLMAAGEISEACCDWLSTHLYAYNAIGIYLLARKLGGSCDQLLSDTKKFILQNFKDVTDSEEWVEDLTSAHLEEIIVDDDLQVGSEEDVVYAVIKWFSFDKSQRVGDLPNLLSCTRLEHTSSEFLEILLLDPDIQKSQECVQIIQQAKNSLSKAPGSSVGPFPDTEDPRYEDEELTPLTKTYQSSAADHQRQLEEFRPPTPCSLTDREDLREPRHRRKDGEPDMRYKENRDELLRGGRNKDGTLDRRTKEYGAWLKEEAPKRKDGGPDMRFKVNRDLLLVKAKNTDGTADQRCTAIKGYGKKKDGSPDMRFKVNKGIQGRETTPGDSSRATSAHLRKDGEPDMRYKVNRKLFSDAEPKRQPLRSSPVKKDGTPDMRFAVNKQARGTPGRSTVKSQASSAWASSSYYNPPSSHAHPGPLKRDGTPDMRYAVNQAAYGSKTSTWSVSSPNFVAPSSHGYSTSSRAYPGPMKGDGTPDMRYAANKAAYGSSSSITSGRRSCGPLKKDGTPDMRYAANRKR